MSFLLLESGDTLLLESGDAYVLEDHVAAVTIGTLQLRVYRLRRRYSTERLTRA